ncbi:hypothetical protein OAL15_02605 [Flavobacteriales bacterium]|nr:hypothetical protein [Flavobacteriales bacterium]
MNKYIKQIAILSAAWLIPLLSAAQETLHMVPVNWTMSGYTVNRTLLNLIVMVDMSQENFEKEMREIGANISIGESFCIDAAEQIGGSEISLDCPAAIFTKCEWGVKVLWYSNNTGASGMRELRNKLMEHYLGKSADGVESFGAALGNERYLFRLLRKIENNVVTETLLITNETEH